MTRYYITDPTAERGFVELTETEWFALIGDDTTRPYAGKLYRGEITIEEVPEDLCEAVQSVVDTRIARWGLYEERNLSDTEALNIITGGSEE